MYSIRQLIGCTCSIVCIIASSPMCGAKPAWEKLAEFQIVHEALDSGNSDNAPGRMGVAQGARVRVRPMEGGIAIADPHGIPEHRFHAYRSGEGWKYDPSAENLFVDMERDYASWNELCEDGICAMACEVEHATIQMIKCGEQRIGFVLFEDENVRERSPSREILNWESPVKVLRTTYKSTDATIYEIPSRRVFLWQKRHHIGIIKDGSVICLDDSIWLFSGEGVQTCRAQIPLRPYRTLYETNSHLIISYYNDDEYIYVSGNSLKEPSMGEVWRMKATSDKKIGPRLLH